MNSMAMSRARSTSGSVVESVRVPKEMVSILLSKTVNDPLDVRRGRRGRTSERIAQRSYGG